MRTEYIQSGLCPYCGNDKIYIEFGEDIETDIAKICPNCQEFIICPICGSSNIGYCCSELWFCGDCITFFEKEYMQKEKRGKLGKIVENGITTIYEIIE